MSTERELILEAAWKKKKLVLIASTSEVYGKNTQVPFHEDADLVLGPTTKGRWSYAASKALDEFLALSYWKEKKTAGHCGAFLQHGWPAADGALRHGPAEFCEARLEERADRGLWRWQAVALLLRCARHRRSAAAIDPTGQAIGEVINIGNTEEVSIEDLAKIVKERTKSSSSIQYVPYDKAYEPGFEDMMRRVPNIDKLHLLTGFRPQTSLAEIIDRVAAYYRAEGRAAGECRKALYGLSRSVTETSLSVSDLFWSFL